MNKKNYFLLFLFFLGSFLVRAQNITVQAVDMPTSVVACGDQATFAFNVFGPLAAGSEITATLPAGSKYASLVSGDVTVTVVSATQVKFKLNNALAGAANTIKVEYKVETACSGLPAGAKVKYETGAVLREVDYPMVDYSLLEVTNVSPASATIAVNATQNYTVTVKQSAATYSNNVKVVITHSTKVTLTAPVGTLTLGTPSAGSQTDVLELTGAQIAAIGDGDTLFENGETITAVVAAKLIGCTTGETLGFQAAYGCGTFSHCTTGNITNVGLGQTTTGNPQYKGTVTKNAYPGWFGQTDTGKVKIENVGTDRMYNVEYRIFTNNSAENPTNYLYYVYSNGNVNGVATPNVGPVNRYYYTMQFTTDPDGAGVGLEDLDGDGFYDDLAAGASFEFGYTMKFEKDAVANMYRDCTNTDGTDLVKTTGHLYYDNACGVRTFGYDEVGAKYNLVLSTYSAPLNSDIVKADGSAPNLSIGDNFNFSVNTYNIYQYYDRALNVGASQAFWRLTFKNVPNGVLPNGNGTLGGTAGTWVYNATASNPAGGILVYDSSIDNINSRTSLVPLRVDTSCMVNGTFTMDYDFTLYQDSANKIRTVFCNTTPSFTLNCQPVNGIEIKNFSFRRSNLGYTDHTLTTQYTEATAPNTLKRTRFVPGDNAKATFSTVVNNVVTNPQFFIEYNANVTKIGNDKVFEPFELKNAEGTEAIGSGFRDGVFTIKRGITTYNFPFVVGSAYYTYTQNNGAATPKTLHKFDVKAIIQQMKTAGTIPASFTLQVGDELNLSANYKVAEGLIYKPSSAITRLLSEFKAYVKSDLAATPIVSNEVAESPLLFLVWNMYSNSLQYNTSQNIPYSPMKYDKCNEAFFGFYNALLNNDPSNLNFFPNEYRPFAKYNRISFLYPSGLEIKHHQNRAYTGDFPLQTDAVPFVVTRGYNIDGTVNPTGGYNKIVIEDPTDLFKYEASGIHDTNLFTMFLVKPKPILATQFVSGTVVNTNWLADTEVEIYANSPENKRVVTEVPNITTHSITDFQNFTKPVLNSASTNVTTATNNAVFDVNIVNQTLNNGIIPNAWLAIEAPNNNIVPTLWEGATQIPLTSYGAGKYYANLGNIAFNTTKDLEIRSNNFTVCGTDNFTVKTGWDCTGYPVDPQQGYTNQGNVTPYSQNLAFSLTTQNPSITTTSSVNASSTDTFDICNNIDESLTVTNGANGYAYEIEPTITLPVGMSFVNGSFKLTYGGTDYTINSADVTLVSGTTYKVNIYNSGAPFVSTGLPGTSSTDPKSFVLGYQVSTICTAAGNGNYTSGSRINYSVNAESGCGQALPLQSGVTVIRSQPINLNGTPIGKAYDNKLESLETDKTKANHHVNDEEELVVTVINQGDPTGNFESIKILVDDAYDYVAGSTVLQAGNTFAGFTAVDPSNTVDASGQRVLEWTVPTGFVSGQTILFNFKVKATDASAMACEATHIMAMNTYVGSPATCAINGEVCNLQFPTGVEKEVSLLSFTPAIGAVINSSVFGSNAGNTTYNNQSFVGSERPTMKLLLNGSFGSSFQELWGCRKIFK